MKLSTWCVSLAVSFSLLACGGGGGTPGGPDADLDGDPAGQVDARVFPPLPDAAPPVCGDGAKTGGEACDDGNADPGDGCAADCLSVEPGWGCGDPGDACVRSQVCGNALLEPGETCDDHNVVAGDGCDATCAREPGWACPVPGIRCSAAECGDGFQVGFEQCDDGDADDADGCSALCKLEPGFACETPGAACVASLCGDGDPQGLEECDDMNNDLGDGCDPLCHREPSCVDGVCEAVCGDAVIQTGEACDDGNLFAGDGCAADCTVEAGFTCAPVVDAEPSSIAVAIVYRDFRGNDLAGGHPDFQNHNGTDHGIVTTALGADHKPVYASATTTPTTAGAEAFASWYRDAPGVNMSYAEELELGRTPAGTYVYDDASFFPLDGRGFIGAGTESPRDNGHNFSFTSELRYWFDYQGGEVLSFRGDDDVWVYINGHRAIELGGVHSAASASITLDATAATNLGLTVGGTYEIAVFQAERHTTQSSYKLTLDGFAAAYSACDDLCGDGVTSSSEACDDGVNMGGYGSCTPGCLGYGPRCGDGEVQLDHEQCDDGINAGGYGNCLPTCELGPRCGDGIVQPAHESCDDQNDVPDDGCDACQMIIE